MKQQLPVRFDMINWGAKQVWLFAITLSVLAIVGLVGYQRLGHPAGSLATTKVENVVPAIGPDNTYQATAEFCKDKDTEVRPLIIPDSTGYELIRVQDGKTESIAVVFSRTETGSIIPTYAKYDNDSIEPIPAAIDRAASDCLQDKVKSK